MRDYRRLWIIALTAIVLAILLPAYWIALHAPAVGMFHDDGVYLVTAKALATGHGYRIISLPGEIPQTKYPILFPFVLSLVWRLAPDFPANIFALKLVPFAFGLIWFWLSFRLTALETSRRTAAICTGLTASLLWSVYLSTSLLSETMFAALCTGCLLTLRRAEIRGVEGNEWSSAAILAGLACLTRAAGVCAIAAGLIYFVRRRSLAGAAKFLAIALLICGPWFLWVASQHPPQTDAYYSAANYGSWNILSPSFPLVRKITVVGVNAMLLLRSPLGMQGIRSGALLQILLSMAFLLAGLLWLRPWTVIDIFLMFYVAMMLAWAWPPDRFVVVIYPLVLLWGLRVWRAVGQHFSRWSAPVRAAGLAIAVLVLAQSLWRVADAARETPSIGGLPVMGPEDAWNDISRQIAWIRDRTPADSIVLANIDPVFYLYTGRKAVRGFQADPYALFYSAEPEGHPVGTLADLRNTIRNERVSYIVLAPNRIFAEAPYLNRLIRELIQSEPDTIRLVSEGADRRFQIYQVKSPG